MRDCKRCNNSMAINPELEESEHGICHPCASEVLDDVMRELEPVADWYADEEEEDRPIGDLVKDVVADLQRDRKEILRVRGEAAAIIQSKGVKRYTPHEIARLAYTGGTPWVRERHFNALVDKYDACKRKAKRWKAKFKKLKQEFREEMEQNGLV